MALNDNSKNTPPSRKPGTPGGPPLRGARVEDDDDFEPASRFSIGSIRSGVVHSAFMKVVLGLLIAIFAVGFAISGLNGGGPRDPNQPEVSGPDPIAQVGNTGIPAADFQNGYLSQESNMARYGQKTQPAEMLSSRQRFLDSMIETAALEQAAVAAGVTVSSEEIDTDINKILDDSFSSVNTDPAARRQVEAQYGSVDKAREEQRKNIDRDKVEKKVLVEKFEKQQKATWKVTDDDYKKSVTKLNLYQIIIRPKFVPPTGKDDEKAKTAANTEAKTRMEKIAKALKGKPLGAFMAAAKKDSEDFMSKDKSGLVGWKLPNEIQVPEEIKEKLVNSKGNLVGPFVDEKSNEQYLFYVAARVLKLPDDYAKKGKKEEYMKNFTDQRQSELWTKFKEATKKAAKTDIYDPALIAYKMQQEQIYQAPPADQKRLREEAIAKYEEGLKQSVGPLKGAIYYQMAQLYRDLQQPAKQIDVLKKAIAENASDHMAKIELARALRETKDVKAAMTELQKVSKDLDGDNPAPSMFGGPNPNDMLRQQIASEYEALNKKDLAEKERKKVKPAPGGGGMGGMPNIQMN